MIFYFDSVLRCCGVFAFCFCVCMCSFYQVILFLLSFYFAHFIFFQSFLGSSYLVCTWMCTCVHTWAGVCVCVCAATVVDVICVDIYWLIYLLIWLWRKCSCCCCCIYFNNRRCQCSGDPLQASDGWSLVIRFTPPGLTAVCKLCFLCWLDSFPFCSFVVILLVRPHLWSWGDTF